MNDQSDQVIEELLGSDGVYGSVFSISSMASIYQFRLAYYVTVPFLLLSVTT